MGGIPRIFSFFLESPSLDLKLGESAWFGCGWGAVEPRKLWRLSVTSASKHKSQEKSGAGTGDVHSGQISTGARQGMGFKNGLTSH